MIPRLMVSPGWGPGAYLRTRKKPPRYTTIEDIYRANPGGADFGLYDLKGRWLRLATTAEVQAAREASAAGRVREVYVLGFGPSAELAIISSGPDEYLVG